MVISSTNIKKKSPLILTELTEHKQTTTYDIGNLGPGSEQVQKCGTIKPTSVMTIWMEICIRLCLIGQYQSHVSLWFVVSISSNKFVYIHYSSTTRRIIDHNRIWKDASRP